MFSPGATSEGLRGFVPSPIVANLIGYTADDSSLTTYTFTNAAIGDAAADRLVVVAIHARSSNLGGRTVAAVTIGGVAAVVDATTNAAGLEVSTFAYLPAAAGSTATVTVTLSALCMHCAIAVYALTGLVSAIPSDSARSVVADPTVMLTPMSGSVVIGSATTRSLCVVVWTGPTEVYDNVLDTVRQVSGALRTNSGTSETVTTNTGGIIANLAAIAWK